MIWEPLRVKTPFIADNNVLELKEAAIWKNTVLNRRAAKLARSLCTEDGATLRSRFPRVAHGLPHEGPYRFLVLVEGLTQAEAIAHHLRDWPILTDDPKTGAHSLQSPMHGVIATASGAKYIESANVAILLRLDIGHGAPPLPLPNWMETADPDATPLIVIDFDCRSHPILRQWQKSRRQAYVRAGCRGLGEDPDVAALARFVAMTSSRRARPCVRATSWSEPAYSLGEALSGVGCGNKPLQPNSRGASTIPPIPTVATIVDTSHLLRCFTTASVGQGQRRESMASPGATLADQKPPKCSAP